MREYYRKPIIEILYMAEDDILLASGEGVGSEGFGDGYTDDPFE